MKKPDIGLLKLGGYAGAIIAIMTVMGFAANYVHDAVSQEIDDFRQEQAVVDAQQNLRTDPIERDFFEDQIYYAERSLDDIIYSLRDNANDPDLLRRKAKAEKRIARFEAKLLKLDGEN